MATSSSPGPARPGRLRRRLFARAYDAAGVAVAASSRSTPTPRAPRLDPRWRRDADGDFVVAWTQPLQDGTQLRRLRPALRRRGRARRRRVPGQHLHHERPATRRGGGATPTATSSSPGRASGQDGSGYGVFAQRFDAAGRRRWAASSRSTPTPRTSSSTPRWRRDADGDFVVTWASLGQDGIGYGIFARRYDAAGVAQASEFQVNTYTTGDQTYSSVAALPDGGFVVAWASLGQDGSDYGIFAQRYDASGNSVGQEFRLNRDPRLELRSTKPLCSRLG